MAKRTKMSPEQRKIRNKETALLRKAKKRLNRETASAQKYAQKLENRRNKVLQRMARSRARGTKNVHKAAKILCTKNSCMNFGYTPLRRNYRYLIMPKTTYSQIKQYGLKSLPRKPGKPRKASQETTAVESSV